MTLCVASQQGFIGVIVFHYRLGPETFGYILVYFAIENEKEGIKSHVPI